MAQLTEEITIYAQHVLALFWPNKAAPALSADSNESGELTGWENEDFQILIEEGRRQIDRQHEDLEKIRNRAQVLLAFGLALEGTIASFQTQVVGEGCLGAWACWVLALLAGGWSILGAGATSVVRADMEIIHAAVLSRRHSPIAKGLAEDYAAMGKGGENQLATRLTNLRHAVAWLLLSGFLGLISWLLL